MTNGGNSGFRSAAIVSIGSENDMIEDTLTRSHIHYLGSDTAKNDAGKDISKS